jgi:mRNA interferase RelE/StbE
VSYRIILKPSAERELSRLPLALTERIERTIDALAADPRPAGVKKMQGAANLWRVRVGDYRIVYEIHDREIVIMVLKIAHRKDVYR